MVGGGGGDDGKEKQGGIVENGCRGGDVGGGSVLGR